MTGAYTPHRPLRKLDTHRTDLQDCDCRRDRTENGKQDTAAFDAAHYSYHSATSIFDRSDVSDEVFGAPEGVQYFQSAHEFSQQSLPREARGKRGTTWAEEKLNCVAPTTIQELVAHQSHAPKVLSEFVPALERSSVFLRGNYPDARKNKICNHADQSSSLTFNASQFNRTASASTPITTTDPINAYSMGNFS